MFLRRTAVVVFAVFSAAFAAPQSPQSHLAVKVTDTSGNAVPGARVHAYIAPYDALRAWATTDDQGNAALDLPPGSYSITVNIQGMNPNGLQIVAREGFNQSASVILGPELPCTVCMGPDAAQDIPLVRPSPDTPIPLQNLEALNLLPAEDGRESKRWWRRPARNLKPVQTP
jgi:hypothetical protein